MRIFRLLWELIRKPHVYRIVYGQWFYVENKIYQDVLLIYPSIDFGSLYPTSCHRAIKIWSKYSGKLTRNISKVKLP